MPLPRLELETSAFDTMLGFMHQPDEPKSLSSWKEVGNPLILHNRPKPTTGAIGWCPATIFWVASDFFFSFSATRI